MRIRSMIPCLALLACFFCLSCGKSSPEPVSFQYQENKQIQKLQARLSSYPAARFIVLSDLHYYHPELGTTGPDFSRYIQKDRKMLALSDEILESAMSGIRRETADFILICGDLTKDGERISHKSVAGKLKDLHPSARVYVIPGNHDIQNPEALQYTKQGSMPVATVGPDEFKEIYAAYGYNDALARDPASLSYVAEPVDGLWIFALDSCLWRENQPEGHPVVDGRFSGQTLEWIEKMLIGAKQNNKAAIAMMHHGLVEHYPANEKYYGQYVIDHSDAVARLLVAYGVRLVFTGHFHAQDITVRSFDSNAGPIFDIETGSLVTWPCPWRRITLSKDQTCTIESRFVNAIGSMPDDFDPYARNFAYEGTIGLADDALEKYKVSRQGMDRLSPQIAEAYLAHLAGDEQKPENPVRAHGTGLMGRVVLFFQKDLLEGWWTDLPPPDNRLVIDLEDGSWHQPPAGPRAAKKGGFSHLN